MNLRVVGIAGRWPPGSRIFGDGAGSTGEGPPRVLGYGGFQRAPLPIGSRAGVDADAEAIMIGYGIYIQNPDETAFLRIYFVGPGDMKFIDSQYRMILLPEIDAISDPVGEIGGHFEKAREFIEVIPEKRMGLRYAEGKWSPAEIVGHLIDTQIIWTYRILWIARGEKRRLDYADENLWNSNSRYQSAAYPKIRGTYRTVCASTEAVVSSIPDESLAWQGNVNGIEMTTLQAVATLIAHEQHHLRIIQERYLVDGHGI